MLHYCTPARLENENDVDYSHRIDRHDRGMDRLGILFVAILFLLPMIVVAALAVFGGE